MPGMKPKTIKAVLRKRIDAWVESLPEELRAAVKRDTIVTGGCIASMLLGEKVNDFDVYFRKQETVERVAAHYVEQFKSIRAARGGIPINIYSETMTDVRGDPRVRIVVKSAGVESAAGGSDYAYFEDRPPEQAGDYVGEILDNPEDIADLLKDIQEKVDDTPADDKFKPVFLSSNAISLSGKIQIVLRFFGEPDAIHANYDFVHCTNYWTSKDSELVLRGEALQALLTRSLVYQGSRYPLCSIIRVRKFVSRGWRINAGQILKMCLQLQEIDLRKYENLEDQLTGVDVAYFMQVLDKVKEKNPEAVDSAYLIEIVDRMFSE